MNSNKFYSKMIGFKELDIYQKTILFLLYDKKFSPDDCDYLTPKEIISLGLVKNSSLHLKLKDLLLIGYIDVFDGKYTITDKFLADFGKLTWEDLSVKQMTSTGYIKDMAVEKIEQYIRDSDELLLTNNQKQDLFLQLKQTSNILLTFKSFLFNQLGATDGAVQYNRFVRLEYNTP
jgi:hypothetical protein